MGKNARFWGWEQGKVMDLEAGGGSRINGVSAHAARAFCCKIGFFWVLFLFIFRLGRKKKVTARNGGGP